MADRLTIVPAELWHAEEMAPRMRQADVDEVYASSGLSPVAALRAAVRLSDMAWTGLVDGEVAFMFGVGAISIVSGHGVPWLLGTDLLTKNAKSFIKKNAQYVQIMQNRYSILENYVDARNTTSIRWLKWLGFTIHPARPHGVLGLPFHHFERRAEYV